MVTKVNHVAWEEAMIGREFSQGSKEAGVDLLVVWATTKCQLSCGYCYMRAGEVPEQDLDPDLFSTAISVLPLRKGATVEIAGGEPTLVPEVVSSIAEKAWNAGAERVGLQTNGIALDDKMIDLIRRYRLGVGVSLDGPPQINDMLRGRTAEVIRGLGRLEAAGIAFGITTVLTKDNLADLSKLALILGGFSMARSIGLDVLRPLGRGAELTLPQPSDIAKAMRELAKTLDWLNQRRRQPLRLRELSATDCHEKGAYCAAEKGRSAVLTPDGGLWPCASLVGMPQYACGSVAAPNHIALQAGLSADASACDSCVVQGCRGRCPSRLLSSKKAGALDCALRKTAAALKQEAIVHAA